MQGVALAVFVCHGRVAVCAKDVFKVPLKPRRCDDTRYPEQTTLQPIMYTAYRLVHICLV